MSFKDLTPRERITAVHIDLLGHPEFATIGILTQVGKVTMTQDPRTPTARTNGADTTYNADFIGDMTREELRYLVAHENLHKRLYHCVLYPDVSRQHPEAFAKACDYVVNGMIECMDPMLRFVNRPRSVPPLVDPQYMGLSTMDVFFRLLKNSPQSQPQAGQAGQQSQQPGGAGNEQDQGKTQQRAGTMDQHVQNDAASASADAKADLEAAIEQAVAAGAVRSSQLRGEGGGGVALSGFTQRRTDWRGPLRRFLTEVVQGEQHSRLMPPNRRFMPLDILLPSAYAERAGELVIACDTSGSMGHVYPKVFGEIANICQTVKPSKVRVLWWDTEVRSEQVFTDRDYAALRNAMKPQGGGGTTVSCVAQYMKAKRMKPTATVLITDGMIERLYEPPAGHLLWGVVDNTRFVPRRGKVVYIT